jgi:ribulose kinase
MSTIGIGFGTDSVRAVQVDSDDGREIGSGVVVASVGSANLGLTGHSRLSAR